MADSFTYEDAAQPAQNGGFSYEEAAGPAPKPQGTISRIAGDVAKSLKAGVQELPGQLAGIADIVPALAFNARPVTAVANAIGEATGFQPGKWAEQTTESMSPEQHAAAKEIEDVWNSPDSSAGDIATAYARNPAYVLNLIARSAPSMVSGGLAGRAAMGVGRAAGAAGEVLPGALERTLGKWAAPVAGGLGEGAVQAGQQMVEGEGQADQRKNAVAAVASGAIDAAIGAGSGRVANALGFHTLETALAGGKVAGKTGAKVLGPAARITLGALDEGILQELPQSIQEQLWQNWAAGKPLWDGVPRQAVEGALAGLAMGAGANVRAGEQAKEVKPPLLLTNEPDPLLGFPDGTVARRSEMERYIAGLPEDQRAAARAKMMGLGTQAADETQLGATYPNTPAAPPLRPPLQPSTAAIHATDFETAPGAAPQPPEQVNYQPVLGDNPNIQGVVDSTLHRGPVNVNLEPLGPISRAAALAPPPELLPQPPAEGKDKGEKPAPTEPSPKVGAAGGMTGNEDNQSLLAAARARPAIDPNAGPISRAAAAAPLPAAPAPAPVTATTAPAAAPAADVPRETSPQQPAAYTPQPGDIVVDDHFEAAHAGATSPLNSRPEPTEAQKHAENYPVGRTRVAGMTVSIENGQGSTRHWKGEDGTKGTTLMADHYGRLLGTLGADSTPTHRQHLDVLVKVGTPKDWAGEPVIVDTINPKTGAFDEHKIIFGASSVQDAREVFARNYGGSQERIGAATPVPMARFKAWAYDGQQKTLPFGKLKAPVAQAKPAQQGANENPPVSKPGAHKGLRVGITPQDAEPVTVRDGVVHIGNYPALDFDSGEPVRAPEGAGAPQIAKALRDAGALPQRAKVFGLAEEPAAQENTPAAPPPASASKDGAAAAANSTVAAPSQGEGSQQASATLPAAPSAQAPSADDTGGKADTRGQQGKQAEAAPSEPDLTPEQREWLATRPGLQGMPRQRILTAWNWEQARQDIVRAYGDHKRADEAMARIEDQALKDMGGMYPAPGEEDKLAKFEAHRLELMRAEAQRVKKEADTPGTFENKLREQRWEQQLEQAVEAMHRGNLQEIEVARKELEQLERQGRITHADLLALQDLAETAKDSTDVATGLREFLDSKEPAGREGEVGKEQPAANEAAPATGFRDPTRREKDSHGAIAALDLPSGMTVLVDGNRSNGIYLARDGKVLYVVRKGDKRSNVLYRDQGQWPSDIPPDLRSAILDYVDAADAAPLTHRGETPEMEKAGEAMQAAAKAAQKAPATTPAPAAPTVPAGAAATLEAAGFKKAKEGWVREGSGMREHIRVVGGKFVLVNHFDKRGSVAIPSLRVGAFDTAAEAVAAALPVQKAPPAPKADKAEIRPVRRPDGSVGYEAVPIAPAVGKTLTATMPNVVVMDVRGFNGEKLADLIEQHDGTPKGIREAAERVLKRRAYEFGGDASHSGSRMGATDKAGKPAWVISPNLERIEPIGTREARYIWGDLSAAPTKTQPADEVKPAALPAPAKQPTVTGILYHGSRYGDAPLQVAPHDETGLRGIAFTPDVTMAQRYANDAERPGQGKPRVIAARISSSRIPTREQFYREAESHYGRDILKISLKELEQFAAQQGITAIDTSDVGEAGEIFVLDPKAIQIEEQAQTESALPAAAAAQPSAETLRAQADLNNALADLADLLGKPFRANIAPEQEARLVPILTRVLDAAFRLGFHKFKDAARFALETIRDKVGADVADALTLEHLQGAYIAMSGGKAGADGIMDVAKVTDKEELGAPAVETAPSNADTGKQENLSNERTDVHGQGPQALDEVAAPEGAGTAGERPAGGDAAGGGQGDAGAGAAADAAGLPAARGGRSGTGAARAPRTRAGRANGGLGARGTGKAGAGVPATDAGLKQPPGAPSIPAANFRITPELRLGRGGEVEKFTDNLAAIRTLKAIESEGRRATPEEQALLARYVGWGGLANAFPDPRSGEFKDKWKERGEALRELLTPSEYAAARRSTRNAHYTSEPVVASMWNMAQRLGFRGGMVLESSMGTGNFLGLAPQGVPARFIGVEYDSLTARIGQLLYPQAAVLHSGFQKVPVANGMFALNIGNPPFGSESLRFQYKPELAGVSIHNQFFRAGLDAVRPGGLQIMVVSRFLMDAQDHASRVALATKARLVAAYRLPDTAFKENARTEVVTDIVILQRREPSEEQDVADILRWSQSRPSDKDLAKMSAADRARFDSLMNGPLVKELDWMATAKVPDPLGGEPMVVNRYFARNPQQILGTLERSGSMQHGADITVRLDDAAQLPRLLQEAVDRLPEGISNIPDEVLARTEERFTQVAEALRIAVANEEPGHLNITPDGVLQRVIEREAPEGGGDMLARQVITPDSPWSDQLSMDSEGRWYRLEVVTDESGKKVKQVKDGKATNRNTYQRTTFATEADVPGGLRLGQADYDKLRDIVKLRDLTKRQIVLETEDAPAAQMEGNRKALAAAYEAFTSANGPLNRPANLRLAMTMPDGGLVAALESEYEAERTAAAAAKSGLEVQPERAVPAPILRERVVPKYEPATDAASPDDALAITLAERGRVDMERIAALLGKTQEEAAAALQAGDKPLVFRDPETQEWETADAYLSGMVKRKLEAARAAGMELNARALEAVQPEPWTAENVTAQMGATWVPSDVYADFAKHLIGGQARVSFGHVTNSFTLQVQGIDATKESEWSSDGAPASYILQRLMNSQPVLVMETDSDGNTRVNQEATTLAIAKGKEIVNEFGEWVFKDAARRARLVDIFNEKFNLRRNRQFDGSHLRLPGKVPDAMLAMRRHQKNVIWRGIVSRFLLVDHAVGAGKTFAAIARAMERRRMGLARKPVIVVPNHLVEQWAADVYRLYPAAKVLAAGQKDFESKRRRRLFSRIATGDWDIVIVPHSSFGFIGIAPETEARFLEAEMREAQQAVDEAWEQAREDGQDSGRRKPFGVKEAERLLEKLQTRMDKITSGARDKLLTFEQLGIDDLTVDEAHEFKNLFYSSRLTGVRGMGNKSGVRKAADLYNKVRILRESGGAVTFLTGTPISNSAVEMFTMMRYLAASELEEMGLTHFDAWRTQFVEATPAFEPTESGRLKEVTRLGRTWSNMRSLMDLYYQFTDAVTNDDIKKWYAEDNGGAEFPVPKVKGGERQLVKMVPTQAQQRMLDEIIAGFDHLPDIDDPYERNIERLHLMDRARKVSLDVRAVDRTIKSDERGGKLERVASEIKRIYDAHTPNRGTQVVFLDRSVPKSKGDDKRIKEYDALVARRDKALREGDETAYQDAVDALDPIDANEIEQLRAAQAGGWNAYQQIKDNLVAAGVPASEVRFIQEANNDEQKQALFDAVKGGKVRVLLGSTQKMGAGTNVQDRLVAEHHVDVTWKPSDIEQREGRIIRQGNLFVMPKIDGKDNPLYDPSFEVEILAYATERTIDAKMWDLNATKLRTINGIRKYDGAFTMDFEDEDSVSMAEMAALASGNPLLLERVTLESQIGLLELQERAHRRRHYGVLDEIERAEDVLANNPARIERGEKAAAEATARVQAYEASMQGRSVTIEGQAYTGRMEAAQAAQQAIETQQGGNDKARWTLTVDGKRITSKAALEEALSDALGDVDAFQAEVDGHLTRRRAVAARVIAEKAAGLASGESATVGRMMGADIVADVEVRGNYKYLSLTLVDNGKTVASTGLDPVLATEQVSAQAIRPALDRMVGEVGRATSFSASYYRSQMERAVRDLPALRARQNEPFAKEQELADKRQRLARVVQILSGAAPANEPDVSTNLAQTGAPEANETDVVFSRADTQVGHELRMRNLDAAVSRITAGWLRRPDVRVIADMDEAPEPVRAYWQSQNSKGAESGAVEGFHWRGNVYVLADAIASEEDLRRVLYHEALGHFGLRGVFGERLNEVLDDIVAHRPLLLAVKARQYGLDLSKLQQARLAAEEVLAELAQKRPELGWVRRTIAAIRSFLRRHGMLEGLTDDQIIRDYILPARNFVERGRASLPTFSMAPAGSQPQFGRSENQDIQFSLANAQIVGNTGRAYTPEQERAMRNVGWVNDPQSFKERLADMRKNLGKRLAQGLVDQFAPVKDISREAYGLLRLAKGASGAFEVLLQGGQLKIVDGAYDFDEGKRGGVIERLLKPLQGEHHDFFRWVAANRAEQLTGEGRERLFTPGDIAAIKTLADGQLAFDYKLQHGPRAGQTTRSRSEAYADSLATFNEFNKNTLDLAQQSGLIDGESRAIWEKEFYVPFYRVADEGEGGIRGMNIKNGVVRQQAFKQLKGGAQKLNADLLENTLMNWAHLIDAAAKNRAAKASLEAMGGMGAAIEAREQDVRAIGRSLGKRNNVVWFMDGGRQRFFLVDDPYLLAAVSALEYAGFRSPVMKAMGAFKHALTLGVTASPFFKVRNLIRDSVQAIASGPLSYNPAKNLREGWAATREGSDDYFRLLAGGGTIHFGTMMEGSEAKRVQALVDAGIDRATILDSAGRVKDFYRKTVEPLITAYNELGNRGEAVNRAALYQQLRAQGVSHAEASLQARDLMDFSMQGSYNTVRFLTQVVPFMNARMQGLYKLGRAAQEDPARFAAVLGATALASIGLMAAYSDDDDWKKREDWDRNNYWWFKAGGTAYRIPKPFEIGAIATLAERSFELAFDREMTGERFREQVVALMGDNLSMNPIPQIIKPVLDVYANKDSFTGRPIETMGMERLRPDYRFRESTTMFARGVSTTLNAAARTVGGSAPSPVQIDHMLRGYFGWLGAMVVSSGDTIARPATDQPSRPTPDYWSALTGAMVSNLEDAPSRYVSATYAQAKELEQAYGTWRHLIREGKMAEAQAFREDYAQELARYRHVEAVKRAETRINQLRRQVEQGTGTPEEKRERMRQLDRQADQIARRLAPS